MKPKTAYQKYKEKRGVDLLESKAARKIIQNLSQKENYASELSDKLDIDRTYCSELLNGLTRLDLIEKARRTQKQYYSITAKGKRYLEKLERAEELRQKSNNLDIEARKIVLEEEVEKEL